MVAACPQWAQNLLETWFEELGPDDWFRGGEQVDRLLSARFESVLEEQAAQPVDSFLTNSRTGRAAILLFDQVPRNIYRGSSRAYAYDENARHLCLAGLAAGQDRRLMTVGRAFFYLPLEHAEDLALQQRSVGAFAGLLQQAPPPLAQVCRGFLDYAERHRTIIERFGRFPHRNSPLGRLSTPEEIAFLREPGSSF